MECKYCKSPDVKPWWPSARTGAYVCTNKDCTDPEYMKGNGRALQFMNSEGVLDD